MSSIHKRGSSWIVRWRDEQCNRQKSFRTKLEAQRFCVRLDVSPEVRQARITVADLMQRYLETVSVKKKGYRWEAIRLNKWMHEPFAAKRVDALEPDDIENYMESRGIAAGTIRREYTLMAAVFNWGAKKKLISENPIRDIEKPQAPEHRERIASQDDIERLLIASGWDGESTPRNDTEMTMAAFLFGCRTGMRSGEILRIEEAWVDGRVIHLPADATKTSSRRDVALSTDALRILNLVRGAGREPRLFGLTDQVRDTLWRRLRDRAGLGPVIDSAGRVIEEGLNFHDSRASFCTWAASPDPKTGAPRLDVLALARQTGHKNLRMLQRYYRATAEEIAERLG